MCGIFAYLNYDTPTSYDEIVETLLAGLRTISLRGYDSTGVALGDADSKQIKIYKKAGTVEQLTESLKSASLPNNNIRNHVGMAHTRWATHGVVSDLNAHPISSGSDNEFVVVHNGMINNYVEIKESLIAKGHKFTTETDTEVVVRLAKEVYSQNPKQTFGEIIRSVCKQLQGAFALVFMSSIFPNEMVATSYGSPLAIAVNMYDHSPVQEPRKLGSILRTESRSSLLDLARTSSSISLNKSEYFITSDTAALTQYTKTAIHLEDGDLLHFRCGRYHYYNYKENALVDKSKRAEAKIETRHADKGKYSHYMLKEIHEQSESIHNVLRGRVDFEKNLVKLGGVESRVEEIRTCRRLLFIASASSFHAALASRNIIEELTGLAVTLELSTDFLDRSPSVERNDTCVFISQSGETGDVIKALEFCKKGHALCVGITNGVGSRLSKLSDCGIYMNCGPEIGLASTKAYTAQIIALTLFALKLGEDKASTQTRRSEVIQGLKTLPDFINKTLQKEELIAKIAQSIKSESSVLVMGRGFQYATCLEGALKLKEVSGLHSEGVLSGELKHGPLALVDDTMPIVFVVTKDSNYDKTRSSFSQVTARAGRPIIILSEGDDIIPTDYDRIEVPTTVDVLQCVINIIPLQLLSYHVALLRGLDVDASKSIAKVVTV